MKIVIAGSREFSDYNLLQTKLDSLLIKAEDVEIVSGCAIGADKLGERYARERGYKLTQFPANWQLHGKKAGYLRNVEMAQYATHAVLFWNGVSMGTAHMINLCEKYKLNYRVVKF
ncbi:MAG: hypothetical protein N5P05_004121 (plasmid) [Chroococcopsis gigantea SAG 12.99]|jgi:hypothetical protein|nr:hypothetical protein [Chroococcopsis gigantea SAG 12.99]